MHGPGQISSLLLYRPCSNCLLNTSKVSMVLIWCWIAGECHCLQTTEIKLFAMFSRSTILILCQLWASFINVQYQTAASSLRCCCKTNYGRITTSIIFHLIIACIFPLIFLILFSYFSLWWTCILSEIC